MIIIIKVSITFKRFVALILYHHKINDLLYTMLKDVGNYLVDLTSLK